MTCYSIEPKDWIFLEDYGFLSFSKNIAKNMNKNLSDSIAKNFLIMKPIHHWSA